MEIDGRVNEAIATAPNFSTTRFYIHVKPGTYREINEVPSEKTFIALIGDDASTTIIVNNQSNGTRSSTASSATLKNFMAQFLTSQNSAGPNEGQAIAVLDQAKHTAYYKCVFLGYQDTLYAGSISQFFKECDIYRTVDFVFNLGAPNDFIFQNCNVTASPEITSKYNNSGGGANTSQRVNWPGYSVLDNAREVATFSVKMFINGTQWLPQTGIPFSAGF
uniref:Pectinesterase n=1 Tax=Cucumis melo TaxID=3656 RepID=A0A9I9EGY8_CUCME